MDSELYLVNRFFLWWCYHLWLKKKIAKHLIGQIVLDFGCGIQDMKSLVLPRKYIGYDIDIRYSDIANYSEVNADCVIANNVFEHLELSEIDKFISFCKNTGVKRIIILSPNDVFKYFLSSHLRRMIEKEHISDPFDIDLIIQRYYPKSYEKTYFTQKLIVYDYGEK